VRCYVGFGIWIECLMHVKRGGDMMLDICWMCAVMVWHGMAHVLKRRRYLRRISMTFRLHGIWEEVFVQSKSAHAVIMI
jgi:hypothetical protein